MREAFHHCDDPATNATVDHPEHLIVCDQFDSCASVFEKRIPAERRRRNVMRWIEFVVAGNEIPESLKHIGKQKHICLQVELEVIADCGTLVFGPHCLGELILGVVDC